MSGTKQGSEYSIGAVASLTGLPPSTIRTWERRYQALSPKRTASGGRRYSDHDVERLQLLVSLTGLGETISVLAPLSLPELRERVNQHRDHSPSESGVVRIALLHSSLGTQLAAAATAGVEVAGEGRSTAELISTASSSRPGASADVLVLELSLLGEDPVDALKALLDATGAKHAVVEYQFARREQLAALTAAGASIIRGPSTADEIVRVARAQGYVRSKRPSPKLPSISPEAPQRRFDAVQLARLREVTPALECECPSHLSTLVAGLVSFETYCESCISKFPQDADLHKRLAVGTGRARAQLENLLVLLCEHDGIEL